MEGETHPTPERHEVLTLRRGLLVCGVVQGVGFRPFVYRLAMEEGVAGFIGNDTDGVTIEIEGPKERVEAFLGRLHAEAPPLSRIDSVAVRELPASGEAGFRIVPSEVLGRVSTGIPADAATCAECLRELLDPADRRYRYPFLNCTNCGPRFTITASGFPYRCLRSRSRMTAASLVASTHMWNPPMPLMAMISPATNRSTHAVTGSLASVEAPCAFSIHTRGPQSQHALGCAWKRRFKGSSYSAWHAGHILNFAIEVCGRS